MKNRILFHLWLIAALASLVPTLVSMPTWSEFLAAFERVDAAEGLSDKVTKQVNRGGDHAPVGTSDFRRRKGVLFGILRAIIQLAVALEGPGLDLLRIREAELEGAQSLSRDRLESSTSDVLDELRALYPSPPEPPITGTPAPAERSRSPPRILVEGLNTTRAST